MLCSFCTDCEFKQYVLLDNPVLLHFYNNRMHNFVGAEYITSWSIKQRRDFVFYLLKLKIYQVTPSISTHFHLHCNKYDFSLSIQNDWHNIYSSHSIIGNIPPTVIKQWQCNKGELKSETTPTYNRVGSVQPPIQGHCTVCSVPSISEVQKKDSVHSIQHIR